MLDFRFEEWKIHQTEGAEYVPNLARPNVPDVGGDLTIGAFNVLNYFTTMGSHGANNAEEYQRQEDKIVSAILEMDADVLGLMEIENNDDVAVNSLVDALNERDNTHLAGSCDAERTAAALVDWVDAEDMPRPVITGDLNAYDHEAPITTLKDGGYTDLREHFDGEEAYSYVFDGQLGYLDCAMAGEELMPFVSGAASWHANSDEVPIFDYTTRFKQPAQQAIYESGPYRASDHDPVLLGLSLT